MNKPVHYDLEQIEKQLREQHNAVFAKSDPTEDQDFMKLQERLLEALIPVRLLVIEYAANRSMDPHSVMCLLGQQFGNLLNEAGGNVGHRHCAIEAMVQVLNGDQSGRMATKKFSVHGVSGGNG